MESTHSSSRRSSGNHLNAYQAQQQQQTPLAARPPMTNSTRGAATRRLSATGGSGILLNSRVLSPAAVTARQTAEVLRRVTDLAAAVDKALDSEAQEDLHACAKLSVERMLYDQDQVRQNALPVLMAGGSSNMQLSRGGGSPDVPLTVNTKLAAALSGHTTPAVLSPRGAPNGAKPLPTYQARSPFAPSSSGSPKNSPHQRSFSPSTTVAWSDVPSGQPVDFFRVDETAATKRQAQSSSAHLQSPRTTFHVPSSNDAAASHVSKRSGGSSVSRSHADGTVKVDSDSKGDGRGPQQTSSGSLRQDLDALIDHCSEARDVAQELSLQVQQLEYLTTQAQQALQTNHALSAVTSVVQQLRSTIGTAVEATRDTFGAISKMWERLSSAERWIDERDTSVGPLVAMLRGVREELLFCKQQRDEARRELMLHRVAARLRAMVRRGRELRGEEYAVVNSHELQALQQQQQQPTQRQGRGSSARRASMSPQDERIAPVPGCSSGSLGLRGNSSAISVDGLPSTVTLSPSTQAVIPPAIQQRLSAGFTSDGSSNAALISAGGLTPALRLQGASMARNAFRLVPPKKGVSAAEVERAEAELTHCIANVDVILASVVHVAIADYDVLWDRMPSSMSAAVRVFNEVVDRVARAFDAAALVYRSRGSVPFAPHGGYHLLLFRHPHDALHFATLLHDTLLLAPWPDQVASLSDSPDADGPGVGVGKDAVTLGSAELTSMTSVGSSTSVTTAAPVSQISRPFKSSVGFGFHPTSGNGVSSHPSAHRKHAEHCAGTVMFDPNDMRATLRRCPFWPEGQPVTPHSSMDMLIKNLEQFTIQAVSRSPSSNNVSVATATAATGVTSANTNTVNPSGTNPTLVSNAQSSASTINVSAVWNIGDFGEALSIAEVMAANVATGPARVQQLLDRPTLFRGLRAKIGVHTGVVFVEGSVKEASPMGTEEQTDPADVAYSFRPLSPRGVAVGSQSVTTTAARHHETPLGGSNHRRISLFQQSNSGGNGNSGGDDKSSGSNTSGSFESTGGGIFNAASQGKIPLLYGAAVMKAALLCGSASGGETVVSQQTYAVAQSAIQSWGFFARPVNYTAQSTVFPSHTPVVNDVPFPLFSSGEVSYQVLPPRYVQRVLFFAAAEPLAPSLYNPTWWLPFHPQYDAIRRVAGGELSSSNKLLLPGTAQGSQTAAKLTTSPLLLPACDAAAPDATFSLMLRFTAADALFLQCRVKALEGLCSVYTRQMVKAASMARSGRRRSELWEQQQMFLHDGCEIMHCVNLLSTHLKQTGVTFVLGSPLDSLLNASKLVFEPITASIASPTSPLRYAEHIAGTTDGQLETYLHDCLRSSESPAALKITEVVYRANVAAAQLPSSSSSAGHQHSDAADSAAHSHSHHHLSSNAASLRTIQLLPWVYVSYGIASHVAHSLNRASHARATSEDASDTLVYLRRLAAYLNVQVDRLWAQEVDVVRCGISVLSAQRNHHSAGSADDAEQTAQIAKCVHVLHAALLMLQFYLMHDAANTQHAPYGRGSGEPAPRRSTSAMSNMLSSGDPEHDDAAQLPPSLVIGGSGGGSNRSGSVAALPHGTVVVPPAVFGGGSYFPSSPATTTATAAAAYNHNSTHANMHVLHLNPTIIAWNEFVRRSCVTFASVPRFPTATSGRTADGNAEDDDDDNVGDDDLMAGEATSGGVMIRKGTGRGDCEANKWVKRGFLDTLQLLTSLTLPVQSWMESRGSLRILQYTDLLDALLTSIASIPDTPACFSRLASQRGSIAAVPFDNVHIGTTLLVDAQTGSPVPVRAPAGGLAHQQPHHQNDHLGTAVMGTSGALVDERKMEHDRRLLQTSPLTDFRVFGNHEPQDALGALLESLQHNTSASTFSAFTIVCEEPSFPFAAIRDPRNSEESLRVPSYIRKAARQVIGCLDQLFGEARRVCRFFYPSLGCIESDQRMATSNALVPAMTMVFPDLRNRDVNRLSSASATSGSASTAHLCVVSLDSVLQSVAQQQGTSTTTTAAHTHSGPKMWHAGHVEAWGLSLATALHTVHQLHGAVGFISPWTVLVRQHKNTQDLGDHAFVMEHAALLLWKMTMSRSCGQDAVARGYTGGAASHGHSLPSVSPAQLAEWLPPEVLDALAGLSEGENPLSHPSRYFASLVSCASSGTAQTGPFDPVLDLKAADVWMFGVMLWYLATGGSTPFTMLKKSADSNEMHQQHKRSGRFPSAGPPSSSANTPSNTPDTSSQGSYRVAASKLLVVMPKSHTSPSASESRDFDGHNGSSSAAATGILKSALLQRRRSSNPRPALLNSPTSLPRGGGGGVISPAGPGLTTPPPNSPQLSSGGGPMGGGDASVQVLLEHNMFGSSGNLLRHLKIALHGKRAIKMAPFHAEFLWPSSQSLAASITAEGSVGGDLMHDQSVASTSGSASPLLHTGVGHHGGGHHGSASGMGESPEVAFHSQLRRAVDEQHCVSFMLLVDLLHRLLQVKPANRPSMREVMEHPFFAQVPTKVSSDGALDIRVPSYIAVSVATAKSHRHFGASGTTSPPAPPLQFLSHPQPSHRSSHVGTPIEPVASSVPSPSAAGGRTVLPPRQCRLLNGGIPLVQLTPEHLLFPQQPSSASHTVGQSMSVSAPPSPNPGGSPTMLHTPAAAEDPLCRAASESGPLFQCVPSDFDLGPRYAPSPFDVKHNLKPSSTSAGSIAPLALAAALGSHPQQPFSRDASEGQLMLLSLSVDGTSRRRKEAAAEMVRQDALIITEKFVTAHQVLPIAPELSPYMTSLLSLSEEPSHH